MARWRRYFRSPENHGEIQGAPSYLDWKTDDIDITVVESTPATQDSTGAAKIQAAEAVGGRKGRYLLYAGYVIRSME